jgi:hypothetical protein
LSRIRLTGSAELRSEYYSGMVLFGQSYWMDRLKFANKKRWRMKSEVCGKKKLQRWSIIQLQIVWHS